MIDQTTVNSILQKKLDFVSAKFLHVLWLARLDKLNYAVDFLGLAVPILGFPFRLYGESSRYARLVDPAWEIIAACLLICTLVKIVYGWQGRAQLHRELLAENVGLIRQADKLLHERATVSRDAAELFFMMADRSEVSDLAALKKPSVKNMQRAHRQALMECLGTAARCGICGASPFIFKRGSCQVCGNTPSH